MKFTNNFKYFYFLLGIFFTLKIYAQETKPIFEIGQTKIKLNEPFLLTAIIKGKENRPICVFPELPGFKKRTNSFSRLPNNTTFDQKFIQEYTPNKTGNVNFTAIKILVDGETYTLPNFIINITIAEKDEIQENFKDFIDGSAYEFVAVKDDAFFAITTNKTKPYVGEGFLITVAFYIAQNNKAEMDFFNENIQLDAILKKIRPKNCWEENLGISEIKGNRLIKIGKKSYFQYKIYQAIYYPLNNQPIQISAQKWQMLKYKIAKDQEVSKEKKEDFKTYLSKPINIRPIVPPKNSTNATDFVGDFELFENIENTRVQTGKSFKYNITIRGDGNLKSIKFNEAVTDSLFEIFEPEVIHRKNNVLGKLIDEKSFNFEIVPKFAGNFSLKDYFSINYFNVRKKTYQNLQAQTIVNAVGRDFSNDTEVGLDENDIYENLGQLKSNEKGLEIREIALKFSNILIITMLMAMFYIFWPTKK